MATFIHGGDCTEDLNDHLREILKQVKGMEVCSADTVLRGFDELSTPTEEHTSDNGVVHEFNNNDKLNDLLVNSLLQTQQLNTKERYTLDYDNVIIPTEKKDAKRTFKGERGYQPGVATMGNRIVHIQGRNGNSPAKYQQEETLEMIFENLKSKNIKINRLRADNASFQKGIIQLSEREGVKFYIRASSNETLKREVGKIPEEKWKTVRIGKKNFEIAEIKKYVPFKGCKPQRIIVSRIKNKDGQMDLFSGTCFNYYAIITNDYEWEKEEIISFYNQRGGEEKVFDGNYSGLKLAISFKDSIIFASFLIAVSITDLMTAKFMAF